MIRAAGLYQIVHSDRLQASMRRMEHVTRFAFASLFFLSCQQSQASLDGRLTQVEIADTLISISTNADLQVLSGDLRVLWQGPSIERPRRLALVGSVLVAVDDSHMTLIDLVNGSARVVGRGGDGPGEFRYITAVGPWPKDSLVAYDGRQRRITILPLQGDGARVLHVSLPFPYVEPRRYNNVLLARDGGVFMLLHTLLDSREEVSAHAALAFMHPDSANPTVLREWDDIRYMGVGPRTVAPRTLFGHTLAMAVGPGPVVAFGDGMEYCIKIETFAADALRPRFERVCREWQAARVGREIRNPDFGEVPDGTARDQLREVHRQQRIPDQIPAYDMLLIGTDGSLWVRTVAPEMARIHPSLARWFPERGPEYHTWERFDPGRRLVGRYNVPSKFTPHVATTTLLYGFYETETGEIVVAELLLDGERVTSSLWTQGPRRSRGETGR
jgi:hypothetical protein